MRPDRPLRYEPGRRKLFASTARRSDNKTTNSWHMTSGKKAFRYIESNPLVCHGQWVFKGTRIMVWCVLEQLESGLARDVIVKEWRGNVTLEAIEEAARFGPGLISAAKRPRSQPAA
jgi:uncharacterized protein (DUF433 family)